MFYDIPFIKIEKQPIQNYKKNKNTLTIHNIFTFRNPKMEYKKERERKKIKKHFDINPNDNKRIQLPLKSFR